MKIYCNICSKLRKSEKPIPPHVLKKTLNISNIYSRCGHEYEKKIKEEESVEMLEILGLIINTEEYQKIHNHVWGKHKSRV